MVQRITPLKRGGSIGVVYLFILGVIVLISGSIMPQVYNSIADIVRQVPDYVNQMTEWVKAFEINFDMIDLDIVDRIYNELMIALPQITEMLPQIGELVGNSLGSIVGTLFNFFKSTFNVFIAFVVCFYVLLEKDKFCIYARRITFVIGGKKYGQAILDVTRTLHQNIGKYLIGKSLDSIFVGICAVIGLSMMNAKYALLLGIIFGITNMVPYIGPIVGTIIAVGINLFYDVKVSLIILVFLVIVQQIETLIIDPKVVGKQLGLSPFFTLFAVSIGGKLFGIPGMILGVPIVAILKKYGTVWINTHYEQRME